MKTVGEFGEAALLAWLQKTLGSGGAHVLTAVGDDAAVLRPGRGCSWVSSTDTLVEGVDFLLEWASFADVGHKAAAVNLSDMAAMAARPRGLLLNLAIRKEDAVKDVKALVRACHKLGQAHGAPLVGGDISSTTGPLVVSVTAMGEGNPKNLLYRHRAKPGDDVWVTGPLGLAAGGLAALFAGQSKPLRFVKHQLRPSPQVELAQALAETGCVVAGADISDGLVRDVQHLPVPGAGIDLEIEKVELDPALCRLAEQLNGSAMHWALCGGEDFELVLAARARKRKALEEFFSAAGVQGMRVGKVVERPGLRLVGDDLPRNLKWFTHFA
jgi:thiamine-monophosphate kinase